MSFVSTVKSYCVTDSGRSAAKGSPSEPWHPQYIEPRCLRHLLHLRAISCRVHSQCYDFTEPPDPVPWHYIAPNDSHRPAYRLWSRYDDFDPCWPLDDDSIPFNLPLDSYRVNVSFSVYCLYDSTACTPNYDNDYPRPATTPVPLWARPALSAVSKTSTSLSRCEDTTST